MLGMVMMCYSPMFIALTQRRKEQNTRKTRSKSRTLPLIIIALLMGDFNTLCSSKKYGCSNFINSDSLELRKTCVALSLANIVPKLG